MNSAVTYKPVFAIEVHKFKTLPAIRYRQLPFADETVAAIAIF
jgi:hypothetical protein